MFIQLVYTALLVFERVESRNKSGCRLLARLLMGQVRVRHGSCTVSAAAVVAQWWHGGGTVVVARCAAAGGNAVYNITALAVINMWPTRQCYYPHTSAVIHSKTLTSNNTHVFVLRRIQI